jgi:preprotein translocase subunit SecG
MKFFLQIVLLVTGSSVVEKNLDRLTLFVSAVWVISIVGIGLLIKIG